ncbi:MAG: prepilin-type N-terminal cleavage/methylation domain-containing protein [Deferribacteraceae bacterium]|jgi:prepilin-type N-terminal cleavage/methylation domain-containing protein|nr:prepilin-type N-terminal cleavage/methylation domain-containing protein [Deferribacteraceae bacterium]
MMHKRAFTFVELAIVLVIIGIIMGMLIKGRALIEVSRLKNELRKIERIQTEVAGWFAKTSGGVEAMDAFPFITGEPEKLDLKEAVPDISEADRTHPYNGSWVAYRGKLVADNNSAKINAAGINIILRAENVSPRFACNIELMLDDEDFDNGNGRSTATELLIAATDDFQPCDDWSDAPETITVDYRIF